MWILREGRRTEILKLRIDRELLEVVKEKAKTLDVSVSAFVRTCIQDRLPPKDGSPAEAERPGKLP